MDASNDLLRDLSGNALAIATFVFFIRYFIQKEGQREKTFEQQQNERDAYFGKLIETNTQALHDLQRTIGSLQCQAIAKFNGHHER